MRTLGNKTADYHTLSTAAALNLQKSGADADRALSEMKDRQFGTLVIGGSQAGLAVGHHLMQRGLPFVILDENERIGDAWRKRWSNS